MWMSWDNNAPGYIILWPCGVDEVLRKFWARERVVEITLATRCSSRLYARRRSKIGLRRVLALGWEVSMNLKEREGGREGGERERRWEGNPREVG